jgi:Zn-dependent metalloprotease
MKRSVAVAVLLALVGALAVSIAPAKAQVRGPRTVPGRGTATPSFVSGIREGARRGTPVQAALGHLKANRSLYRISDPVSSLVPLRTVKDEGLTTVKFAQKHRGLSVFGGGYLVHMRRTGSGYEVESANGEYFTDLDVSTTPTISAELAISMARRRARPAHVAGVQNHGLVVLPGGSGGLSYHLTVAGTHFGKPLQQEVFTNAHTGSVALTYNNLQHAHSETGSGLSRAAQMVPLEIMWNHASLKYEMRDTLTNETPGGAGQISTHDANGSGAWKATNANIVKSNDSLFNDADNYATSKGAVDAHHGARSTYDFYSNLGRNSIDDGGMSLKSTVNMKIFGFEMANAFWDGTQVVYGNLSLTDGSTYPFSAARDVVAHEITHGVTQFSVDGGVPNIGLVYINQSGAMNEAYSDYFGEAVEIGTDMADLQAGLLGEDLCVDELLPEDEEAFCPALRDMNDGLTVNDYQHLLIDFDNGGVHINSTIYSGALWAFRQALYDEGLLPAEKEAGAERADGYVYMALNQFTTPLHNFYDGYLALESAINTQDLPEKEIDLTALRQAFGPTSDGGKGITTAGGGNSNWETTSLGAAQGTNVMDDIVPFGIFFSPAQLSGRRFIVGSQKNKENPFGPLGIYVGDWSRPSSKKIRVNPRRSIGDESPDIVGTRAVWSHLTSSGAQVHGRVLGRPVQNLTKGVRGWLKWFPSVHKTKRGTLLAWEHVGSFDSNIKARYIGKDKIYNVSDSWGDEIMPQVHGPWIAWWDLGASAGARPRVGVKNILTGKKIIFRPPSRKAFLGPPSIGGNFIYWYQDDNFYAAGRDYKGTIMKARLGRSTRKALFSPRNGNAPMWAGWTAPPAPSANAGFVTWSDERCFQQPDAGSCVGNAFGRNVWFVSKWGGTPRRKTTHRGDQAYPVIGPRRRILWIDGYGGRTQLRTKA